MGDLVRGIGSSVDAAAQATDFAERQIVLMKQQISSVEDADVTASILQLNDARQLQETALAAEARRPRTSLFEYLR